MASPVLLARVRELWEDLAGAAAEFRPVCEVVVSPGSALCPPGWTGIVVIGAAAIVTAQHVRQAAQAGAWRAPPPASRHFTRALGFGELGVRVLVRA